MSSYTFQASSVNAKPNMPEYRFQPPCAAWEINKFADPQEVGFREAAKQDPAFADMFRDYLTSPDPAIQQALNHILISKFVYQKMDTSESTRFQLGPYTALLTPDMELGREIEATEVKYMGPPDDYKADWAFPPSKAVTLPQFIDAICNIGTKYPQMAAASAATSAPVALAAPAATTFPASVQDDDPAESSVVDAPTAAPDQVSN